jgi:hypothetical protein
MILKNLLRRIHAHDWKSWLSLHFPEASAASLHLTAVVLLHSATIPSLVTVMLAWTDRMPQIDMVILTWAALVAMFVQALIQRNLLIAVAIAVGFMLQALLMALIFFH